MEEKFYTSPELMKLLNVSKRTLIRWRQGKKIKFIKFGRFYRYPQTEVERISEEGVSYE